MHALYSICILSLADFVHGAAFNPLYHQNHDIASQPVKFSSIPMDKIHEARDGSQGTRRYSKQAHWFPSGSTNRIVYRRIPDPVSKSPTLVQPRDDRPTPAPTGDPSLNTTVHISDAKNFALIAPKNPQQAISDAEADGVSFCTSGATPADNCSRTFPDGFITAAAIERSDDGAWIQVTGCIDRSKFPMSKSDDGGQFDVRYPNGAQCTFGGYGASFIQQIEPSANRFCMRCCASENDQTNCNSHQDRAGCPTAIPGTYDFPNAGISCV